MGPLCFASALPPALFFAMTALISPDQYHATAQEINAMPKHLETPPMRIRANHCRCRATQCPSTASQCLAIPMLCHSTASLLNTVAPLSHGNTLPGPFIAIQCLYFAMPVLTSRYSASAIRFLSLPQRNVTYPRQRWSLLYTAHALKLTAVAFHRYSMPLLRYARLDLSVQRLSDTILVIATAKRYLSTPLQNYLCFTSAHHINTAS